MILVDGAEKCSLVETREENERKQIECLTELSLGLYTQSGHR